MCDYFDLNVLAVGCPLSIITGLLTDELLLLRCSLRSAHTEGLVPATSPGHQVPSCELPIFTRKSSRRDLSLQVMLVPACELSVGQVPATK